ncbi:ABC transporter substrate-binding protein [Lyngbya confervoides]|uniref:ABC transporter substrate-binding protein n=1 Tax=Lyngbya confervoides BDU141951 TaxID=1574623 RepID=A0ABD4SYS9_9CYAN|nr:ABC transporter substrate-binding protein [Lyngbya confervoides]MCM1981500.1 ABC transporter substrate-binding protein [Lyngbya confervoides BDU141951]
MSRRTPLHFLSLFCIFLLLAVGCGRPSGPASSPSPSVLAPEQLVIGINTSRIRTLDPADAYEIVSGNLLYNLGDRLYTYEPESGELVPQLASALPTISEDGLIYTIPLRQGVKFHDGEPFNAEAMAFSLNRFIQNTGKPSFLLSDIIFQDEATQEYGIRATGDYELTLELKQPFAAFTDLLAFSGLVAVSPKAYQEAVGANEFLPTEFVGTGPYQLDSFGNDLIRLKVFPDYWGEAPKNQGINVKLYSSSANLFNAFRTGSVDMTYQSLEPVQIEALINQAEAGDWQVTEGPGNVITYLTLNLRDEDLKKVEVRQALAAMIDRPLLEERVFRKQSAPLFSLIPTIFDVSEPVFEKTQKSVAEVKDLLKQVGYDEQNPLTLDFWFRSNVSSNGAAASTIKAVIDRDYAPVVQVNLKSIESATAYENLDKGTYPIFMLDWYGDFYDPDNYVQPFMDCEQGNPEQGCEQGASQTQGSFFFNDRVNELIDQQRQTIDPQKRKAIFKELQEILVQEVPFIPLWQNKDYVFAQTNVQGIQLQPTQQFSFAPLKKS